MRLPLLLLVPSLLAGCGARVLWTGDDDAATDGVVEPMSIWDEVPCPGYFDGLTCPPGCPVRVPGENLPQVPGAVYCAPPCGKDKSCPIGTDCYEGRCLFVYEDITSCRPDTGNVNDLEYCAPAENGSVLCAPFHIESGACPYDSCYAPFALPDGTNFCTIDCRFNAGANADNPCVSGADCPWESPLPDGRVLCLPICESDADCFGGLTCADAICQWPAAAR
jgi:hypothetical protein